MVEPRMTRTQRYLLDRSPRGGFDGIQYLPQRLPFTDPTFVPRLSIRSSPKLPIDSAVLGRAIEADLKNATFFCDTSVFDTKVDARLWDALLAARGRVAVIPEVMTELQPWLEKNPSHPAARAIANREENVRLVSGGDFNPTQRSALEYYVNLLGYRKRLLQLRVREFERLHGREPVDDERKILKNQLHATWGSRTYSLVKKDNPGSKTRFADEVLVSMAMFYGLTTGNTVVLLTKDEDLLEQFYKLQRLLDTHYRSMLLADLYASDFSRFRTHQMPRGIPAINDAFVGRNDVLIETWDTLVDELLPPYCNFVPIHCWIVGAYFSELTFGGTRELEGIITTKGNTKGQNTTRLGARNCHLWLAPLPLPQHLGRCAAIAEDRTIIMHPGIDVRFPLLDINQAIYPFDRFKEFKYTPLWTPE